MDLSKIKEKLGEDFTELKDFIDDLTGQRDAARKESIDGRHKLKGRVKELETGAADMLERLGVESLEELEEVDIKGQAEAVKQYLVKLKRADKELAESRDAVQAITGKYRESQLAAQIGDAIGAHSWVDKDLIALRLKAGIGWEEDEPHFEADGKIIGIKEAADFLAQKMPHMIKAGTGRFRLSRRWRDA